MWIWMSWKSICENPLKFMAPSAILLFFFFFDAACRRPLKGSYGKLLNASLIIRLHNRGKSHPCEQSRGWLLYLNSARKKFSNFPADAEGSRCFNPSNSYFLILPVHTDSKMLMHRTRTFTVHALARVHFNSAGCRRRRGGRVTKWDTRGEKGRDRIVTGSRWRVRNLSLEGLSMKSICVQVQVWLNGSHSASWEDLEKLMLPSEREKQHGSGT